MVVDAPLLPEVGHAFHVPLAAKLRSPVTPVTVAGSLQDCPMLDGNVMQIAPPHS
jgi:hypothetical protein